MIIDIFLILIILFSLFIILKILFSKFPILVKINIEEISKEKERKLKLKILEKKIIGKIKNINLKDLLNQSLVGKITKKIKNKIINLEERYYKKYNEIIKEKPIDLEKRIKKLFETGNNFLENKNFNEAEKIFKEIIYFDPRNTDAFNGLLKTYLSQKNFTQAKDTIKHIIKLIHQKMRWCLELRGEIPKEIIDEFVSNIINLGIIYQENDQRKRAINCFRKALEYSPGNPRLLDFLIENSIILNKKEEAKNYLNKIKEINPENQKIIEWEEKIKNLPR